MTNVTDAKVTVTREVAEAIEYLRTLDAYSTDAKLLVGHAETLTRKVGARSSWAGGLSVLKSIPMDTFARIVLDGYTVEKTPEEKVREYYDSMRLRRNGILFGYDREALALRMHTVRQTLDILGIKIEGVNA